MGSLKGPSTSHSASPELALELEYALADCRPQSTVLKHLKWLKGRDLFPFPPLPQALESRSSGAASGADFSGFVEQLCTTHLAGVVRHPAGVEPAACSHTH